MRQDRRRSSLLTAAWCAFTFLLACACGHEPDLAQAERDLGALVPKDTVAAVRVASLAALDQRGAEMAELTGDDPSGFDIDRFLSRYGGQLGAVSLMDRQLPLVFALSMPRATPPAPVLIVPTTDPAAYIASIGVEGAQPVTRGSYVAVPLGGRYELPDAPSPLLKRLGDSVVTAHADVQKIVRAFGPVIGVSLRAFEAQIEQQMEQETPDMDAGAIAELYIEIARGAIQSVETVDVDLDLRDGEVRAFATLRALPGSAMDGWSSEPPAGMRDAFGQVRADSAFVMVGCTDWPSLGDKVQPFLDTLIGAQPEQFRDFMAPLMKHYADIQSALGPAYAMDMGFSDEGISFQAHVRPPDVEQFRALYAELLGKVSNEDWGIHLEGPTRSESDGTVIDDYRLSLDAGAMARASSASGGGEVRSAAAEDFIRLLAGSDAMVPVRIASGDGRAAIDFGEPAEEAPIDPAAGGTEPPPALAAALARFEGCNPFFVEIYDLRRFISQAARQMGESEVAEGGPSAMMMGMGIRGREWRVALTVRIADFPTVMVGSGR